MSPPPRLLRFPATRAGFEVAATELRARLLAEGLDGGVRFNVELVFEEVVTNIVRHASSPGGIEVAMHRDDDELVLMFEDDGPPFDPLAGPDQAMPASIDDASPGGRGVLLVRKLSSRASYARTSSQRNRLTLALRLR